MPPPFALLAQVTGSHVNGSGLALVGGILAILLRKHPVGGWLFYFFWQVLLVLGLIAATTQWRLYRSGEWGFPGDYFFYLIANLPRTLFLAVIGIVWVMLVRTRQWEWVVGLRYTLATYAFLTLLKLAVDTVYFPTSVPLDALSLAFPCVWMIYFGVSLRVRSLCRQGGPYASPAPAPRP